MDRRAKAQWSGDLKSGKGLLSSGSGALSNTPYSFRDRFEDGPNTNPEELLAAAHAGCFTMALSMTLGLEGLKADSSRDHLHGDSRQRGRRIRDQEERSETGSEDTRSVAEEAFNRATQQAKEGCPVSKLFDTEITLDAKLRKLRSFTWIKDRRLDGKVQPPVHPDSLSLRLFAWPDGSYVHIFQRCHIAGNRVRRDKLPQQSAHDFAASRFRKRLSKAHLFGTRKCANFVSPTHCRSSLPKSVDRPNRLSSK